MVENIEFIPELIVSKQGVILDCVIRVKIVEEKIIKSFIQIEKKPKMARVGKEKYKMLQRFF